MKKTYIEECLERANAAKNTSFIDPLKCEEIEKCGVRIGHNIAYIEGNTKVCDFLLSAIVDVPELCERLKWVARLLRNLDIALQGQIAVDSDKKTLTEIASELEAPLEGSEK